MRPSLRLRLRKILARAAAGSICLFVALATLLIAFVNTPFFARYRERARESELRIMFAVIYGAEKSYHSEYSSYVASFTKIGLTQEHAHALYAIGFPSACLRKWGVTANESYLPAPGTDTREREIRNFFDKVRRPAQCKDITTELEVYAVRAPENGGPLEAWRMTEDGRPERLAASH